MFRTNPPSVVLQVPSSEARKAKEALRILGIRSYTVTLKDHERIYEGWDERSDDPL
jgi:hypothetical protein